MEPDHAEIHCSGRWEKEEGGYYELASGLDPEEVHVLEVVKATEGYIGSLVFKGFRLPEAAEVVPLTEVETV